MPAEDINTLLLLVTRSCLYTGFGTINVVIYIFKMWYFDGDVMVDS